MEHIVVIRVTFVTGAIAQWPVREWRWAEQHDDSHPAMLILFHPLQPDLVQGSRVEIPFQNILFLEVLISGEVDVSAES